MVSDPSSETGVRRVEFVDSPVFSPRRKSLADAIDCTYVCTPPWGGNAVRPTGGRGEEGGKEARNDRRRIVVVVNAALPLFIDMRGLVGSMQ